jgi:hypothetical protein
LKEILKDRMFNPNDEIKEAIASAPSDLTLMTCRAFFRAELAVLHGSLRMVENILLNE